MSATSGGLALECRFRVKYFGTNEGRDLNKRDEYLRNHRACAKVLMFRLVTIGCTPRLQDKTGQFRLKRQMSASAKTTNTRSPATCRIFATTDLYFTVQTVTVV
jgi:hypothetical protein